MLDRAVGIAGIVLALPGFLLLFFTDHETAAVLCLIIGVVLWLAWRFSNLPPFTMKSVEMRLEFKDPQGRFASLSKSYEIRPNYAHLTTITHRNNASDGTIVNIRWNDVPIPKENIATIVGDIHITVPIGIRPRWKLFPGKLSYDAIDSFLKNSEGLLYVADFPAKTARITIQMPSGRPCRNVRSTKIQGALETPHGNPSVGGSGTSIELTLKRPSIGTQYAIMWDW